MVEKENGVQVAFERFVAKIENFGGTTDGNANGKRPSIHFTDGESWEFDTLVMMPPQKPPRVMREGPARDQGLTNANGYVPVDGKNHRSQKFPGIYCLGDCAGNAVKFDVDGKEAEPFPHPKAGGFAIMQGHYVGDVILNDVLENGISGVPNDVQWRNPPKLMSAGEKCFVEGTRHRAVEMEIDFFRFKDKPFQKMQPPTDVGGISKKLDWVNNLRGKWYGHGKVLKA